MKNLANCTIEEFMKTADKVRPLFKEWVTKTGARDPRDIIVEILPEDASRVQRLRAVESAIGSIMALSFEKAPELTRELLCVATFTDPKDFTAHTLSEYHESVMEMYNNDSVRSFFTYYAARN